MSYALMLYSKNVENILLPPVCFKICDVQGDVFFVECDATRNKNF